jgi:hypothetical protein
MDCGGDDGSGFKIVVFFLFFGFGFLLQIIQNWRKIGSGGRVT